MSGGNTQDRVVCIVLSTRGKRANPGRPVAPVPPQITCERLPMMRNPARLQTSPGVPTSWLRSRTGAAVFSQYAPSRLPERAVPARRTDPVVAEMGRMPAPAGPQHTLASPMIDPDRQRALHPHLEWPGLATHPEGERPMAKEHQRGNREAKKPKAAKPTAVSTAPRPPAPPMPPAQKGKSSAT